MKRILLGLAMASCLVWGAAPEEFSTAAGPLKLYPVQHASLYIEAAGKILYIDPALGSYDALPKADYILITDIHGDHMAPKVVDQIKKPSTVILAPAAVAAQVTGATTLANGGKRDLGPFQVEAIPMYNLKRGPEPGKFFHDKGRGNGYIVTFGGKRFYFSGDTEGTPEMRALKNIDVAFVCMNLPYTMTAEEAADAVKAFHPKIVYPYHYRDTDLSVFDKGLAGTGIEVRRAAWYAKAN